MRIEIKPRIRINTDGSIDMFIAKFVYVDKRLDTPIQCPDCKGALIASGCERCNSTGQIDLFEMLHSRYVLSLPGPQLADDISDPTKVLNAEWIPVEEDDKYPQEHWFHIPQSTIVDQASVEAFRRGEAGPPDPRQKAIEECIRFVAEPCGDTIEDKITAGLAADLRAHMEKS